MLNPAHILEIALLLLVAFLVGATAGSLARSVVLRLAKPAASLTAVPVAKAEVEAPAALVTAPAIEPVTAPAAPVAPADIPTPDFAEAVKSPVATKPGELEPLPAIKLPNLSPLPTVAAVAEQAPVMAPARAAGQTTSGIVVPAPNAATETRKPASWTAMPSAEVIPFPVERATAPVEAVAEGSADAAPEELPPEPQPEAPEVKAAEAIAAQVTELAPVAETKSEPVDPTLEPAADAVEPATPPTPVVVEQKRTRKRASDEDEAAAMRAIEGSWSPKRGAASSKHSSPPPEGVPAMTKAEAAAEPIVPAELPGKPAGLDGPRHGLKDNLTNVIGVLPIIETALNNIGVFHFDQIAEFSDENVAWLEQHLAIEGRVGREHWREQARELAAVSEKARKIARKQ